MAEGYAEVYKKGRLAATLVKSDLGLTFSYNADYLAGGGKAVATTLPLGEVDVVNANGAAPAFFAGLLPEGRRLGAIAKRIRTSLDDDLSLLIDIGADLIGDVQVILPGGNLEDNRGAIELRANTSEEDFVAIRDEYFGLKSSGLPGVQDKISARMLSGRSKIQGVESILKFNPDDVPHAVENEYYFLTLAKRCGIQTSAHRLLEDGKGVKALMVERFDRTQQGGLTVRLAAEDGCQASNKYPAEKMNLSLEEVTHVLIENCAARNIAAYELFKQVVFSWLTGNGDTHAKNFSMLENELGEWEISPAYDLLCTRFYDDRDMALTLRGETTGWTKELLIDFAGGLGLSQKVALKVIGDQLKKLAGLPSDIGSGALPFARNLNYDVENFLKKRFKSLS